jgi:hypothetical protein
MSHDILPSRHAVNRKVRCDTRRASLIHYRFKQQQFLKYIQVKLAHVFVTLTAEKINIMLHRQHVNTTGRHNNRAAVLYARIMVMEIVRNPSDVLIPSSST